MLKMLQLFFSILLDQSMFRRENKRCVRKFQRCLYFLPPPHVYKNSRVLS